VVEVTRLPVSLILSSFLTIACQDYNQSSSNGSGSNNELKQTDFVAAFQDLACQNLERCCGLAGYGFDPNQCPTVFAGAGQGSGSSVFNPSMGEQCLAEMGKTNSCGSTNNARSCSLVYTGMLQPGAACTADIDCAKPTGGDANCDRLRTICVVGVRGQIGDLCQQSCERYNDGSAACVWGPASSGSADGNAVVNCFANDGLACGSGGQCVALAQTGEDCIDDASCSRELYCASALGYTCQPRRALGQSCADFTTPCVSTAYCNAASCIKKKANGQSCLANSECLGVCNCGISGDCANTGTCTDPFDPVGNYIALLILGGYCGSTTASQ
jgi:hypothetical protein